MTLTADAHFIEPGLELIDLSSGITMASRRQGQGHPRPSLWARSFRNRHTGASNGRIATSLRARISCRAVLLVSVVSISGCLFEASGAADDAPEIAEARLAISAEDSLGTKGSMFFPIGLWTEGHNLELVPPAGGWLGAAPPDANDAVKYYDEIYRHFRSWGINTFPDPNVDDAHAPKLIAAAENVGLYVVHEDHSLRAVTNDCTQVTDAMARSAVQAAVAAYSSSPALGAFQLRDEPSEPCFPQIRLLSKWLGYYDPSHTGFSALSFVPDGNGRDMYRGPLLDKMLAYDQVTYDDKYPLTAATGIGDVDVLEEWDGRIDDHYLLTPSDKALNYVIQAHHSLENARVPTAPEVRYMTYAALARGAKGIYWFMYQTGNSLEGGVADYDFNINPTGREIQQMAPELQVLAPWLVELEFETTSPRTVDRRSPMSTAWHRKTTTSPRFRPGLARSSSCSSTNEWRRTTPRRGHFMSWSTGSPCRRSSTRRRRSGARSRFESC